MAFLCSVGSSLAAPQAQIQRSSPKRLKDYNLPGMTELASIETFEPMDLISVLKIIDRQGNLKNLVISKGVTGLTARLKLKSVTVAEALEVILAMNDLAYEVDGEIIKIMTDDEYKVKHGVSFYDQRKIKIVDLKYADPERVVETLKQIKSELGEVGRDKVTGTLILIDSPGKILEMEAIIARADIATISRVIPTETRAFALQYASLDDVKTEVASLLTKEVGAIQSDRRTKTLMVTDLPHILDKVADVIEVFDRRPKQVFIEAKIVAVSLTDDFSMGINWDNVLQGIDPRFSLQTASTPGGPATPAISMTYKTIVGGGEMTAVLDALKQVGKTDIISNPHIAVTDGEEASIEVVEDQPYKEVQFESGSTNITGVTYQFKKVGVTLNVTPRISDDGFISVMVKPEISSISQWYDGAPQVGTPVVKKALAETTVVVKDGVTIIIGGLIQDRKDTSTTKVPILGSVPLIGRLFRYDSESIVNTETVVFMTPRITGGDESMPLLRDSKKPTKPLRTGGEKAPKEMR